LAANRIAALLVGAINKRIVVVGILLVAVLTLGAVRGLAVDATEATASALADPLDNPHITCTPVVTTIPEILGRQQNVYGGATEAGGYFQPHFTGDIQRHQLNPPCYINGTPTFVELRGIHVNSDMRASSDGDWFGNMSDRNRPDITNPDMKTLHVEIDGTWIAAGVNPVLAPKAGQIINLRGFVYFDQAHTGEAWHSHSGWEIHPMSGWEVAGTTSPPPPPPPLTPPPPDSSYTFCNYENNHCWLPGTQEVVYGASGKFTAPRQFTDGVDCNNTVFGDPIVGIYKACFRRPVQAPPDSSGLVVRDHDGTAPDNQVIDEDGSGTEAATVSFTLSNATGADCKVDSDPFVACSSPWVTASKPLGQHTVTVRARNGTTLDSTPSVVNYQVVPSAHISG
jgi:hypothetical protein